MCNVAKKVKREKFKSFLYSLTSLTIASSFVLNSATSFEFNQCQGMKGDWVNAALNSANKLQGALNQLKNIKGCSPLRDTIMTLQAVAPIANTSEEQKKSLTEELSRPEDLNALTELNKQIGTQASASISKLQAAAVMGKTVKSNSISAKALDISKRLVQNSGQIVDSLASAYGAECLNTAGAPVAEILGSTLGLVSSYAFSKYGMNVEMGSTINKMIKILRDKNIRAALSAQQTVIFWTQLSCLIESTTDNYCSILSAKKFLKEEFKSLEYYNRTNNKVKLTEPYTPLDSYMIMNQDIHRVSNWVDFVMRGVDPINVQDSEAKNAVLSSMSVFAEKFQNVLGYINETKREFKLMCGQTATADSCKKTRLTKMIDNIVSKMLGDSTFFKGDARRKNFYEVKYNDPNQYAFALLGVDVPPPVLGGISADYQDECGTKYIATQRYSFSEYLRTGKNGFNCMLNSPDTVLETIAGNAKKIDDEIRLIAYEYFNNYIVVDKPNLLAKLHIDSGITTFESFKNIRNYLAKVLDKMNKDKTQLKSEDPITEQSKALLQGINMISGMVEETMEKVDRVIKSIEEVGSDDFKGTYAERLNKATETLSIIYSELDVGLQKNGFLQGRLTTIVDFETRLMLRLPADKVNDHLTKWIIFGQNTLLKMMNGDIGAGLVSPNERQNDIDTALMIADSNMSALEGATKSFVLGALHTSDLINKGMYGKGTSNWQSFTALLATNHPLRKAYAKLEDAKQTGNKNAIASAQKLVDKELWWLTYTGGPFNPTYNLRTGFWTLMNVILDDGNSNPTASSEVDIQEYSKSGAFSNFMDKLCIQSLAFKTSRLDFDKYCKGRKLSNDYVENILTGEVLKSKLSSSYDAISSKIDNSEERVCAYYNYKLRNKGYQILLVLNKEMGDSAKTAGHHK